MGKNNLEIDKGNLKLKMSRVFAAPRQRLWEAHADPEQVKQWFGGSNDVEVDVMEFKVGGRWRFINTGDDGRLHAFRGEYREIEAPEKITWTFEYEPQAGHIVVETITFKELSEGTTELSTLSTFDSIEDLDGMVNAGMEQGAEASWNHLEELVTKN